MEEILKNPVAVFGLAWTVNEIYKHLKNRKNFGLTELQDLRMKVIEQKVTRIDEYLSKHHEINEKRQERILELLDDISDNVLKTTYVMESILKLLDNRG